VENFLRLRLQKKTAWPGRAGRLHLPAENIRQMGGQTKRCLPTLPSYQAIANS